MKEPGEIPDSFKYEGYAANKDSYYLYKKE